MGRYVTNTRRLPNWEAMPSFTMDDGVKSNVRSDLNASYIPMQTTTSYRSGRGFEGTQVEDQLLDHGGTWASATQALKTIDQEDGGLKGHDNGHTFDTVKSWYERISHPNIFISDVVPSWGLISYGGPLILTEPDITALGTPFPTVNQPTASEVNYWGSRAIANVKPESSATNLLQTLIELKREGLPAIWGATTLRNQMGHANAGNIAGRVGGEYLNNEFGWKPLVNDVKAFATAMARIDSVLGKHLKDSGRTRRKRWLAPFTKTTTLREFTGMSTLRAHPFNTNTLNSKIIRNPASIRYTITDTISKDIRFSGAFTHYAPDALKSPAFENALEQANYLLGLELTPEVLYNVAPWTWLIDWFTNVGDIVSNVTAFAVDKTVMRYGYLMTRTVHERTIIAHDVYTTYGIRLGDIVTTQIVDRKSRHRATPYGFGLNPASFTSRQWAILGSLGLTKGDKAMAYNE